MSIPILPVNSYIFFGAYFVTTSLLKWKLKPDISLFFYLIGALIGMHLIEMLEQFIFTSTSSRESQIKQEASPLRSEVVQLVLIPVTFFIITSTKSLLGAGAVLFLNLNFIFQQNKANNQNIVGINNDNKIFRTEASQKFYKRLIIIVFVIQNIIFVLM